VVKGQDHSVTTLSDYQIVALFQEIDTHIYLKFESYNLLKNVVHKGVDFYVQNALKLTYDHL